MLGRMEKGVIMNGVPTKFIVIENWYTDNWDKVPEGCVTEKMHRVFRKYIDLYSIAVDLVNPKLKEWNDSYSAEYDVEYEKYIARRMNEIFSKVKKLNGKIKIRELLIPEDEVSATCGVTIIDNVRYICVSSLKACYD